MDAGQVLKWVLPILARGVAWILAAKLGMEAAQANSAALQAVEALGALVLVAVSVYTSVKGRKTLVLTEPPKPPR